MFRVSMTDSTKRQKKKKDKGGKKSKANPKDICNYCKELGHWKRDCPKKAKKDFVVALVQNDSSS